MARFPHPSGPRKRLAEGSQLALGALPPIACRLFAQGKSESMGDAGLAREVHVLHTRAVQVHRLGGVVPHICSTFAGTSEQPYSQALPSDDTMAGSRSQPPLLPAPQTPEDQLVWRDAAMRVWGQLNLNIARAFYRSAATPGRASARAWVAAPIGSRVERGSDYVRHGERYPGEQRAVLAAQVGEFMRLMGEVPVDGMWAGAPGEGRGVVVVGGGRVLAQSMVALWFLRQTRSTLPAELWTFAFERPSASIEAFLQRNLGARVVVVDELLPLVRGTDGGGAAVLSDKLHRDVSFFTMKVLAVAMSSFREVLLLDADNIPLRDPAFLFDDPLYRRYGAVLWPDFWGLTADPQLVEVLTEARDLAAARGWEPWAGATPAFGDAAPEANPRMAVPARPQEDSVGKLDYETVLAAANFAPPRKTHESGQVRLTPLVLDVMCGKSSGSARSPRSPISPLPCCPQLVIDRTRHLPGLWLALFFMAYPNRTFEYLLSNSAGIGDKESFAWGITAAGGDYAMILHGVRAVGTNFEGAGFEGNAMAQTAPDGQLLFMHANRHEWTCAGVPPQLGERDHRFPEGIGLGHLRGYFQSKDWLGTGGPKWGAGDFEATVWALTRGYCDAIRSS